MFLVHLSYNTSRISPASPVRMCTPVYSCIKSNVKPTS
jgi:hypothetical protein